MSQFAVKLLYFLSAFVPLHYVLIGQVTRGQRP